MQPIKSNTHIINEWQHDSKSKKGVSTTNQDKVKPLAIISSEAAIPILLSNPEGITRSQNLELSLIENSSQLKAAKQKIIELIEEINVLNKTYSDKKTELEKANAENCYLRVALKDKHAKFMKLWIQHTQLTSKHKELLVKQTQLTITHKKLTNEHNQFMKKYTQLTDDNKQLMDKLAQFEVQHTQLTDDHKQLTDKHEKLEVQHTQLTDGHKMLADKHEKLEVQHTQLTDEQERLLIQHGKLTDDYKQLTDDHKQLTDDHKQLTDHHKQLSKNFQNINLQTPDKIKEMNYAHCDEETRKEVFDDSIKTILIKYPRLEELNVSNCPNVEIIENTRSFFGWRKLTSQNLKKLFADSCDNLRSIKLKVPSLEHLSIKNNHKLVEIKLDMNSFPKIDCENCALINPNQLKLEVMCKTQKDFNNAIEFYAGILKAAKGISAPNKQGAIIKDAIISFNLGWLYEENKDLKKAEKSYENALDLYTELNSTEDIAQVLDKLISICQSEKEKANWLKKREEIKNKNGSQRQTVMGT
jgi:hypothetical protein